jgi:glycosyltransferase involved in cell wall biosynthesis
LKIRFIVLNAYAKGGTTRTTLDTASRLAARHDVEVVSVNRARETPVYALDDRVRLRSLVDRRTVANPDCASRVSRRLAGTRSLLELVNGNHDRRFSLLTDIAMAREIRSMRDGLLIGTRPSINLAIARFARRSVYTLGQEHQFLQHWHPALQRAIRRAYPRLDAVTGLTPADAVSYRSLLPAGVLVMDLPNAVPMTGPASADPSSKVVVSVGRLHRQKGFDLLIEAFAIVADIHPDWQLRIYGDGPWRRRLRRQIGNAGLVGTVRLKGFSSSLPAQLADASIFALSSRFEGFSLALVEAMAVGLAPVAFACPQGPREIITDGVDGVLIPPEDVQALAKGICSLIEDSARRAALGSAARESVRRFSTSAVDERWEELIERLCSQRPGSRRHRPLLL